VVVARQQGYYSHPIASERGTTQGDIVSPTIFNIVVDAVVRAWYHSNTQAHSNLHGEQTLWNIPEAIFYADDGNLYSTCAATLQIATEQIVDMFMRMGLMTNANKTKAMICVPGQLTTRLSSPAYRRMMGNLSEATYSARKRRRVICDICEMAIQARSLARHQRDQHGIAIPMAENWTLPHLSNPSTHYIIRIPNRGDSAMCPVPGCAATVTTRYGMRRHFQHRHIKDIIVIEEEGLLPRCGSCGMFVNPFHLNNELHKQSKMCREGTRWRERDERNLECMRATRQTFNIQGRQIEMVHEFRYLGRPLTANDNDWAALMWNLGKARKRWAMISRVLAREGASPRISAMFYKATIQTILLYGSETWVITSDILQVLRSFHHSVARRLTGRYPYQLPDSNDWIYPSIKTTLNIAGMHTMEDYLKMRRSYLETYAKSTPTLQNCMNALRSGTTTRKSFWWKQDLFNNIEDNALT
jgi:hypothetical protein